MIRFYVKAALNLLGTAYCVALLFLALMSCASPTEQPDRAALPACADVWVNGETLPTDYEGCTDGDATVAVVTTSDGTVFYNDAFAAKPGQTIHAAGGQG